jgi:hypothetical protein
MRRALEATRLRRMALAAARENIRVQLLRIGAGIGVEDDLAGELAAARELLGTEAGPGWRQDGGAAVGRMAPGGRT